MPVPDGLPMRLPPTTEQRQANLVQRGMAAGRSRDLGPVPHRGAVQTEPDEPAGLGSTDRLTLVWSTFDIVTDAGIIPSWGGYGSAALDQSGISIQLSDPDSDDGKVYLFGEGLYCVTVQINAAVGSASADQVVAAAARINDRPSALGISCALRGGDPVGSFTEYHATSSTFYSEGRGLAGGGIEFAVKCTSATVSADVGQVTVRAAVQKIASF